MKLSDALKIDTKANVILVGIPEATSYQSTDGETYFRAQLAAPVMVTCSTDTGIEPFQTDEVYLRESAIEADGWKFVDEKDPSKGYYMEGWKIDFSKGQELVLYQETTIFAWSRGQRKDKNAERTVGLNAKLKAKMADKKK